MFIIYIMAEKNEEVKVVETKEVEINVETENAETPEQPFLKKHLKL